MKERKGLIYALAIFFVMLASVLPVFAQGEIKVSGVVTDGEGLPLTGVAVMVPGTKIGVVTGYDGDYSITVKKGSVINFSFIGFETVEWKVDKSEYNVVMKVEHSTLDQVVVTGYSQVDIRKATGAVAVMDAKQLKDSPLKSVDQLLQGKLSGVVVKMTSGRPGSSASVRVRGTNTITGDAEPLWVVDGVPLQKNIPMMNSSQIKSGDFESIYANGIGNINPNDIESITVLKDASAAAIYGSQAAGGVIVVTTKKGQAGKTHVSYTGSVSIQTKPSGDANLMNSREKLAWEQELWNEFSVPAMNQTRSNIPVIGLLGQIRSGYGRFKGMNKAEQDAEIERLASESTDWFDVLFRNSISTSHYISLSGGAGSTTYYVSGGFNRNNGLVVKTSAENYSINAKVDMNPAKWIKLGLSTDFSYMKSLAPSNNVDMFRYAYFANPYEKPYNEDGSYKSDETYFSIAQANGNTYVYPEPVNGFNIMREIDETSSMATSSSMNIRGNATVNIVKGLTFNGLASFSYISDMSENINGKNTYAAWQDRPFENDYFNSKRVYGSITQFSNVNTSYLLRGQFNFSRTFAEKHNVSAIAGSEIRSSYSRSITTKRYGYDPVTGNHSTPMFEPNADGKIDYDKMIKFGEIMDGLSGQSKLEDAFASFYGTATYNYNNRYIASATIRSDGSNNFGSDQQFNANWSVSGSWNVDEEPWMKGISNVLSTLSLRAGFGYTGGVNKSVYPVLIMDYMPTFRKSEFDFYRMGFIYNAPNPNLRWEKNRTFNIGMNFGFLADRITGELSYYQNKNLDQVTKVRVPTSTGFDVQAYNTSEQINQGVEVMLSADILRIRDFRWRVAANVSYNYNELTKYASPTGSLSEQYFVGYPLGHIFTGKPNGINPTTGLYEYQLRPDAVISDVADYRKYENYLFYVGTMNAPWNGGFSTTFSYKNVSLNIVGNYSIGGKIVNNITPPVGHGKVGDNTNEIVPTSQNDLYAYYLNARKDVTHRWTPDNPITDGYPRIIDAYGPKLTDPNGGLLTNKLLNSDTINRSSMLEDLSYLKISSVSLNWTLPDKWTRKMHLAGVYASFMMNNLYTFTGYKGLDPETPGAVYPQARTYSFSLSINF